MKPLPQTLRSATIVAAVALAACQGPPPTSGTWVGKNISFNVSADGAKLTSEASTLENGASLVVGIALESNRFGMSRQTLYLYVDIPIIDGFFNFSDGELEVEGQLHSPTEASGVFRLVDEVQQPGQYGMTTGTVRGTGEWSASPSPTLAQPPERDSTREVKVHFDGLYQAASSQSGVFRYLRFYADGTVVSVSSTGTVEQVARWLNRTASSQGRYTVRDLEIEFSSTSPEGTVDYEGTIEPNGLTLKWYSHINGREGSDEYQFFPKGTDLSKHTADELAAVAAALNSRPRKTLGWRNPAETLEDLLQSLNRSST